MDEIKKKLDSVSRWLDMVTVSGQSVDFLAMARQELRAAYQLLGKEDKDGGQDDR